MNTTEETTKRASYHHGDLRAKLIDATRQLVEERGPDHFSVSEACRRAGVSTAAPYKHFKDKQEMLKEVALDGMRRKRIFLETEIAKYPEASLDRIVAMGRVYVTFAQTDTGVFRLMFGMSTPDEIEVDLMEAGEQLYGTVKGEVAKYHGRSAVTPEDEHKAFLLWSFVHGLSFLLIDGKLAAKQMDIDLDASLRDIARRVMRD
jgi:AcrR family transcriptional regulator